MKTLVLLFSILLLCVQPQAFSQETSSVSSPLNIQQKSTAQIDLNKVSENELRHSFKGIGKHRASAIIAYRTEHGAFTSVAELAKVKSMGEAFVNKHLPELEKVFYIAEPSA